MKLRFAVMSALAVLIASSSVEAASNATTAFVAHVRQHVVFLEQSSKLAAGQSSNEALRAFATLESDSQRKVLDTLPGSKTPILTADASSPTVDSSIDGSTLAAPDAVLTGRSAAIDESIGWNDPTPGVVMAAPGVVVMPHLSTLKGEDFDRLYKATQVASLSELAGFYRAYMETGDDLALRSMAKRELDVVNARLDDLKKL